MERKIGETFEYEGHKLRVVEGGIDKCDECFFYNIDCISNKYVGGFCSGDSRTDKKNVIFMEYNDEHPQEQAEQPKDEQPQHLNLCEILKYCPQGEQFWSPMLGDVVFYDINQNEGIVRVKMENGKILAIKTDGTITICGITSPEVMLYPSREQWDWTKVKYEPQKERFNPKTLKPFDKVLSKYDGGCWSANLFSHIEKENNKYHGTCSFVCNGSLVKFCIPYNDETKHLVGTKDEAPEFYKYWED